MMAATREPRVSKTRKGTKQSAQGAAAVAHVLNAFALLPIHALAEGRNQSIPSLLHDLTGLSKARISQGNLDDLRPSTQNRIHEHQRRWLEAELADPQALSRAQQSMATAPRIRSGGYAPWAGWMHQFEFLPEMTLPISKAVGLAVDELFDLLLAACRDDDPAKFKQVLLRHIEHHGAAVRVGDGPVAKPAAESDLAELRALESWQQTTSFTNKLVEGLYLDLVSTLDAEWSSHYFSGRQSGPLFPLVMVRPQNGLLEGKRPSSRKNLFLRPSRRLLEFLYALVVYIRYRKWPDRPPSPMMLADIFYRPGEDELLDKSVVSSYFDGSTKLTVDLVFAYWVQLYQHFMPERKEEQRVNPPLPMIVLALQWQTLLVRDNGRSFLLLDLDDYHLRWRHRRQQWEAHQTELKSSVPKAGHQERELIEWPAWMLNQSSSSS